MPTAPRRRRSNRTPCAEPPLPAVRRLGIRDARSQLTDLVRRAKAGERVVITVDGVPMAQLGPLEVGGAGPTLDDLASAGLVRPPRRSPSAPTLHASAPNASTMPVDVRVDRALNDLRG